MVASRPVEAISLRPMKETQSGIGFRVLTRGVVLTEVGVRLRRSLSWILSLEDGSDQVRHPQVVGW